MFVFDSISILITADLSLKVEMRSKLEKKSGWIELCDKVKAVEIWLTMTSALEMKPDAFEKQK